VLSTSAYSALEALHIMRYINLLTYLPQHTRMTISLQRVIRSTSGSVLG